MEGYSTGKGKTMTEQQTPLWEPGANAAPLPPLADLATVTQEEQPMVALYRTYGPIFRLPRPGQAPWIILAGPEINVFMARHEDEFFTTGEQWEQFDAMISQQPRSGMTEARDGEANRKDADAEHAPALPHSIPDPQAAYGERDLLLRREGE